jgi:hypothetical protein
MNNIQRLHIQQTIEDLHELEKWISNRKQWDSSTTLKDLEDYEQSYPFGCGYARGISGMLRDRLSHMLEVDQAE